MSNYARMIDWSNPEAAKREVHRLQEKNDELSDLIRSMENFQDRIEGDLSRQLEEARGRIAELEHELKQERLWKLTPDENRDYLEDRYKSVAHDLEVATAREAAKDARIAELEELLDENFQKHCEDVLNSIEAEMRTRLAAKDARIAELEAALRPFANEPLSTEPAHMKTRLWSFEDSDARIQAARDALEGNTDQ